MSSRKFSLPGLYLVAMILLSAGACSSFTGPGFADYEISGTVTDKGTGAPIAGATVSVYVPSFTATTSVAQQTTGADGKYDIKFNARCPGGGTYDLHASKAPNYYYAGPGRYFDCKYGSAVIDFDLTMRA